MKTLNAWLRVRDLERELGRAGFALARIRGSHPWLASQLHARDKRRTHHVLALWAVAQPARPGLAVHRGAGAT